MKAAENTVDTTPQESVSISKYKTVSTFLKNGTCSRTLMTLLDQEFDNPLRFEELATDPLAGGMMQGYQCGMLWGSTLAAGAQSYRLYGQGPAAKGQAIVASKELVAAFRSQLSNINCLEITETDPRNKWQVFWNFFVKGGTFRCMGRAARFAPEAKKAIQVGLHEKTCQNSCDPTSCASKLAKMIGATDRHAVMVAGMAGGLGLSGGACGALGAAIWFLGLWGQKTRLPNKVTNKRISELIERFLENTDYEFECSHIVGREFEDVDDHSAFIEQGGCKKLIEAIATNYKQIL